MCCYIYWTEHYFMNSEMVYFHWAQLGDFSLYWKSVYKSEFIYIFLKGHTVEEISHLHYNACFSVYIYYIYRKVHETSI